MRIAFTIAGIITWQMSLLTCESPLPQPEPTRAAACQCCCGNGPCCCGCTESSGAPRGESPQRSQPSGGARICRCDDAPGAVVEQRTAVEKARRLQIHAEPVGAPLSISATFVPEATAHDAG